MTCIVAIETADGVWMGGDRAGSNRYTIHAQDASKTFTNGPLLIGYTTSFRMGQILQYALTVPSHTLTWDVDRWVATDLMKAIREAYTEHGWDRLTENVAQGGNFLAAVAGRCYEIQSDYSFTRRTSGEYAVGSGEDHAFGSLHSTRDWDDAAARVTAALEAAAEHVTTVCGPFDIEHQAAA